MFDIVALGFVRVVAFGILEFAKLVLLVPTANALWRVPLPLPMPFTAITIEAATIIVDKYIVNSDLKFVILVTKEL